MKKLKFRGKCIDTGKWIYGYGVILCEDIAQIIHKQGINIMQHTNVNPLTVGQYTGLTDNDSCEIFEGDIVKFDTLSQKNWEVTVEWDEGGFWLPFNDGQFIQDEQGDWFRGGFKIIGNIHDKPLT